MMNTLSLVTIFALLGATAFVRAQVTQPVTFEVIEEFKQWKLVHNKNYVDGIDEENRLLIFNENYQKLKSMKSDTLLYKVGLTKFADLTTDEFKATYLGTQSPRFRSWTVLHLDATPLPESVDWRAKSAVTPIKHQGPCGSCWAFAAAGALEGLFSIKNGQLKSLSEQQLIDCSTAYGTYGCNGGLMTSAFKYTRDNGITSTSNYPYAGIKQQCKFKEESSVFKNVGWISVAKNDQVQLANAVSRQPVAAAVQADATVFQFYTGGILDDSACGTAVNHGVLIVGYGSENGKDFWIVKNSWGTSWGESGYVRIAKSSSKTTPGVCGIAALASYPTA